MKNHNKKSDESDLESLRRVRNPFGSAGDFLDQHPLSSLLRSDNGNHVCIELEMEVGFLEGAGEIHTT